jgi:hypothetical protein
MTKPILVLICAVAVFLVGEPPRESLSRFKAVEAYEVRPGILALPRYTADAQVCEISLEKLHHSGGGFRLAFFTRTEIDQIVDQLVPASERGSKPQGLLGQDLTSLSGHSALTTEEYENISIYIYSAIGDAADKNTFFESNIAAMIKWKHRICGTADGPRDK